MKPIFANLRITKPLCLFKSSKFYEEKFDIADWYSRKSTNRHKDDYTIIYFAKIILAFILQNLNFCEYICIKFWNILDNDQRKALLDLANDPSITIKPAEKGGSIVIMNTE